MKKKGLVIGLGEVGLALFKVLRKHYGEDIDGYDIRDGNSPDGKYEILNICIPYSAEFQKIIQFYYNKYSPSVVINHSTVPVGTTESLGSWAVHSPVLGKHDNMEQSLTQFIKWIGGNSTECEISKNFIFNAGIRCHLVQSASETELLKLFCLAKYGMSIAFAQYQKDVFDQHGFDYADIMIWDKEYNQHVDPTLKRPIMIPPHGIIGGHCVVPGTRILNERYPNDILKEILKYQKIHDTFTAWHPVNIYPTAKIGKDVSIGMFSEIGNNVSIGDRTRIGSGCFIPEGVTIEEDVFIGPHTVFANDMYPPSGKENWEKTLIKKGARIGAGVCVTPGVTIGEKALIGMGAVVTNDIPAGETYAGVPARPIIKNRTIRRVD